MLILDATTGRVIGASTSYPYLADVIAGVTDNEYFRKIQGSGHWELFFVAGSFLAGLTFALINRQFELRLVHSRCEKFKGAKPARRILWAPIGGFALIFGARMAGDCTSGLILSGGMQLARSGLIFAAFGFIAFILTGKLFYSQEEKVRASLRSS